jgi:hypothetical protein
MTFVKEEVGGTQASGIIFILGLITAAIAGLIWNTTIVKIGRYLLFHSRPPGQDAIQSACRALIFPKTSGPVPSAKRENAWFSHHD